MAVAQAFSSAVPAFLELGQWVQQTRRAVGKTVQHVTERDALTTTHMGKIMVAVETRLMMLSY